MLQSTPASSSQPQTPIVRHRSAPFFFGADFDAEGIITAELLKAYADENGITGPIKTAIGICFPGVEALNLRRDSFLNRAEELGL